MLSRSTVILIVALWIFCSAYGGLAKVYGYPYADIALIAAWVMSLLLLIVIGLYIKRHKENQNKK